MPLIRGDFGKIAQIGLEGKKKGDRVGKGSKEPQHAFVCLSPRGAAAAAGEAQELLLSYCSTLQSYCSILQSYCSTLQSTTTHCKVTTPQGWVLL